MCRYIHAPLQTYKKERGGKENDGEGCKHFNFACELEEINLCAGDVLFKNISTMTKKKYSDCDVIRALSHFSAATTLPRQPAYVVRRRDLNPVYGNVVSLSVAEKESFLIMFIHTITSALLLLYYLY